MKWLKLFHFTWAERWGLVEAGYYLAKAKIRIRRDDFRTIAEKLKRTDVPSQSIDSPDIGVVKRSVGRMHARLPWENKCLPQALAAAWMLKRRAIPATIYFGVRKTEEEGLKAHAWVIAADYFVTGRDGHRHYSVVSKIEI
jgi:hypothetical protein